MADGRVADMEVTRDTNEVGRKLQRHLGEEHVDPHSLRRRRSRREWPDSRLSFVWDVRVFPHGFSRGGPSVEQLVKELVEALIVVLAEVETAGGEPEQMVEAAQAKLVSPREHLDGHDWGTQWREASANGVRFEKFMLRWGRETGYWHPRLLVIESRALPPNVHVRRVVRPEESGSGMVRTSPSIHDFAVGEYEHMLSRVQSRIDDKTAKRQLGHAPGLKWLFVVLDENMAAVQLDDYFGPACEELDPSERNPYHVLDRLTFDYFDEVWITGRAFQTGDHIVLRLFKTGDDPQHKIVRDVEVPAG